MQIRKAIRIYPGVFEKFGTTPEDVISKITNQDGRWQLITVAGGPRYYDYFVFKPPQ